MEKKNIRKTFVSTTVVVITLLNALMAQNAHAQGNEPMTSSDGVVVSIISSEADARAAEQVWTREMIRGAQPMTDPTINATELDMQAQAAGNEPEALAGPAGTSPQGLPDATAMAEARMQFAQEWQALDQEVAGAGTQGAGQPQTEAGQAEALNQPGAMQVGAPKGAVQPTIYTAATLGNYYTDRWLNFPYVTTGKLYFTSWDGYSKYCSASVVGPSTVVAAAHCLYDTNVNRWHRSWVFVPADRNGYRPFGSFGLCGGGVLNNWINAAAYSATVARYDVAIIKTCNNASGRAVNYYTGWMGRSWDGSYYRSITQIAYPANLYLGSLYTYVQSTDTRFGNTDVFYYTNSMGGGASGSPLISPFQHNGSGNWVAGVQSGEFTGTTTRIGARFSSSNIVPLCNSFGC